MPHAGRAQGPLKTNADNTATPTSAAQPDLPQPVSRFMKYPQEIRGEVTKEYSRHTVAYLQAPGKGRRPGRFSAARHRAIWCTFRSSSRSRRFRMRFRRTFSPLGAAAVAII